MHRAGVDIGGTFTDLVSIDRSGGDIVVGKVPSTPDDPSRGLVTGLDELGVDAADISTLLHGTTVATNAVLEGTGTDCGLLTTRGFTDVLELGWRDRPRLWGLDGDYIPIIPRDRVQGLAERTTADGDVLDPVDPADVRAAGETLLDRGVEAVVVSLLHAYANSTNEKRVAEILREFWPNEYVVRSSAVLPEHREFERTSTAAITAYTQPIIASYLDRLENRLDERGYEDEVLLMQSNGGITTASVATERAANTILSGPAAGATAAARIASVTGYDDVISCDMGGTSFDVAVLPGGDPVTTQDTELAYQRPLRLPMTDITAIGAGGGSIASVDEGGILEVGPESTGADPGPVCYGRGGTDVTITDANLVLGRINPDNPIGDVDLDVERAREVLADDIGVHLDLEVEAAASAIVDVGVNKMVGKLREVSIDKGFDPRAFTLVTFGGAGPLHAGELVRNGDVPRAIVPYYPGILSAIGCLLADVRHDHVRSVNERLDEIDLGSFHEIIAELEAAGHDLLDADESSLTDIATSYRSQMKYAGQTHTVAVELPSATPSRKELREAFEAAYLTHYSEPVEKPIRIDNVQVTTVGLTEEVDLAQLPTDTATSTADAIKGTRPVYFDGEWHDTTVYDRERLPLGAELDGPAILEQADATTVVDPGLTCTIDEYGNAVIEEVTDR